MGKHGRRRKLADGAEHAVMRAPQGGCLQGGMREGIRARFAVLNLLVRHATAVLLNHGHHFGFC